MAWKGDEWEGRFDSVTCCLKGPRSLLMSGILILILTKESVQECGKSFFDRQLSLRQTKDRPNGSSKLILWDQYLILQTT